MERKLLWKIKRKGYYIINTLFGHRQYKKFVVITRSRTGSYLLISLLKNHPNIVAEGEAFNFIAPKSCQTIWEKEVFTKKLSKVKYVGFKIFYYHPLDSDDKSVWDNLKSDKSIKIIHLRRENMLNTIVSRKIAGKTNIWKKQNSGEIPVEERKVTLDPEECVEKFERTKKWETQTRQDFKDHPFFELTYEELTAHKQDTMNAIFSFLQLDSIPVESSLKKQNKETLRDLVTNYDEIEQGLKETPYAEFLNP